MSTFFGRFSPEEKALVRSKEEAQKRVRGLFAAGKPAGDWPQRLIDRTDALLAYRQQHGLLTDDGKRIPYRAAKKKVSEKRPPKRPWRVGIAETVRIVPIDLSIYDTDFEKEEAARRCAAVRFALEKQQAADRIKAGREANRQRIAAIAAAVPQKPLYITWD